MLANGVHGSSGCLLQSSEATFQPFSREKTDGACTKCAERGFAEVRALHRQSSLRRSRSRRLGPSIPSYLNSSKLVRLLGPLHSILLSWWPHPVRLDSGVGQDALRYWQSWELYEPVL